MDFSHIASKLKSGSIGLFQCDTILGIIGPVTHEAANRIRMIKQRSDTKPFLLLIPSINHLKDVSTVEVERIFPITSRFWPGPLTIVLPKSENVPRSVTGGLPSVGIRIPNFGPLNHLLNLVDMPLISTSVNVSGDKEITTLSDVPMSIRDSVDFCWVPEEIIDGGGVPSTIIQCVEPPFTILREGAVASADLEPVMRSLQ